MTFKEYAEQVQQVLGKLDYAQIDRATQEIGRARERGNWVYLFGNGGSAANASHWANGLQSIGVKCHVLDNIPILTALANDVSYNLAFFFQLREVAERGDVAIGFSCSGNSENVLKAVLCARRNEVATIGLTAFDGGMLRSEADIPVHVPVDSYEVGEDIHSIIGHMITLRLKE